MALNFDRTLQESLARIGMKKYRKIEVHAIEEVRTPACSHIIETYGKAKWEVVERLNAHYGKNFDLHNWLNYNESDEVAYFLNEAGSNCLNYADFKAPSKFHLWKGRRGFVIGIEQIGEGFDAINVDLLKLKQNEGAAFEFFRRCKSNIFFDDPKSSNIVFMECLL